MGRMFLLVAFIKLLFVTDSPRFVAGLYTAILGIGVIWAVAEGQMNVSVALLAIVLRGAIAFGYFWGLHRLKPWTSVWWAVVVGGALLMMISSI
jgi:hypothetical protein